MPEQIINKPGRLTREEFEKMKVHPLVGAEILERVAFPYPVAPIVRSHHDAGTEQGIPKVWRERRSPSERAFWLPSIAWMPWLRIVNTARPCPWESR